jgi:hypothetical protein
MKLRNNITFGNIIDMYEEQSSYTFDSRQIDELKTGYDNGINIEAYADPIINYFMMFRIRREIEDRRQWLSNPKDQCRFAQYVYNEFDGLQLDELAIGLSKGVNVDVYAHRSLNHEEMYVIRRGLEMGVNVLNLVHNGYELHEIHEKLGVDNFYEIEE